MKVINIQGRANFAENHISYAKIGIKYINEFIFIRRLQMKTIIHTIIFINQVILLMNKVFIIIQIASIFPIKCPKGHIFDSY